ncbi:hypothetical protein OO015_00735 [Thermomicrobium sp. 4228-Ro]|uniref:hypothetical protein n=1 Tax=Thermomicrobium sp. 4228-Ro TaxID=2993937 RepID=UPI0022488408|nr:hypothetical protein [Thermomicrobium sp. 4228-Ro]MCX2726033.1 hypothetical protein [Thermomicrobium sp. 4228-Ro]
MLRVWNRWTPLAPAERVLLIPASRTDGYRADPLAWVIGTLAHPHRLPARPPQALACCRRCWSEHHQPLLGTGGAGEPSVAVLPQAIAERSDGYTRAFQLVEDWARAAEPIGATRRALKPFLDPPLSADGERVTHLLDGAGSGVRQSVWRVLRERYRRKLLGRMDVVMPERAILDMAGRLDRLASRLHWSSRCERSWGLLHDGPAVALDDPTHWKTQSTGE